MSCDIWSRTTVGDYVIVVRIVGRQPTSQRFHAFTYDANETCLLGAVGPTAERAYDMMVSIMTDRGMIQRPEGE